jgi:hypothetical protein
VTNPPIDPIREKLVMSLHTVLGWRRNLLSETPEHCRQIILESPLLLDAELEKLVAVGGEFPARSNPCVWPVAEGVSGLENAIRRICREAEEAVDGGIRLLVLSDRRRRFSKRRGSDAPGRRRGPSLPFAAGWQANEGQPDL